MPNNLYDPARPSTPDVLAARAVPADLHDPREGAAFYQPSSGLVDAVNVALALGAPLLLTGEPGCGKTQLAWHLVRHFGIEDIRQPFQLSVKSTTTHEDLLWGFDTVRYFHDGQDPQRKGQPLDRRAYREKGPLWLAIETANEGKAAVVLIDEIDKAPRDFPNDLLHELDQYDFVCKPTGEPVRRDAHTPPPVVIVTSNSEKRLPDAFLRRCVFHHLELDEATVREAVIRRLPRLQANAAVAEAAIEQFWRIRKRPGVRKKPSTGELLGWVHALHRQGVRVEAVRDRPLAELPCLGVLIKDEDDRKALR